MAESAMEKKYGAAGNNPEVEDRYARLVARAWSDEGFAQRLLASPAEVLEEFDMGVGTDKELRVILGEDGTDYWILPAKPAAGDKASVPISQPPDWYQQIIDKAWSDDGFKARLLADPREAAQDFGVKWPAGRAVRVVEDTAGVTHFIVPAKPEDDGMELSDELLESIAGGFAMQQTTLSGISTFQQVELRKFQLMHTTGVRG